MALFALAVGLAFTQSHSWPMFPKDCPVQTRVEFAKALARVEDERLSEDQVRNIIGSPDYVGKGGTEWYYGSDGPGTMATLGTVKFGNGRVQYVSGQDFGDYQGVKTNEASLRAGMQGLKRVVDKEVLFDPENVFMSNPGFLIRAVNYMWSLSEPASLDVLEEYARVTPFPDEWVSIVATILCEAKSQKDAFNDPYAGGLLYRPENWHDWPKYPIVIVDDIPFDCSVSFGRCGSGPCPYRYISSNRSFWKLRPQPLRPGADPFASAAAAGVFARSHGRVMPVDLSQTKEKIREQTEATLKLIDWMLEPSLHRDALSLVESVYRPDHHTTYDPKSSGAEKYSVNRQRFLALGAHWNEKKQDYVLGGAK